MTITQIVLASLNIIVAIAMFYLAGQSAYARQAWTAHVRGLERLRDGFSTADWIKELRPEQLEVLRNRVIVDENTLSTLEPADRQAILARFRGQSETEQFKSDEAIRQEIAALFWNTGLRTITKKDGENKTYTVTEQKTVAPGKLLDINNPDNADIQNLARKLGPIGFSKLVRAAAQHQYPQLDLDVREAAAKLYFARARLADAEQQKARVKNEVEELSKRRDIEKELLRQAEFENLERRREITKLEADVEEAMAALTVALGREADRKRLFEEIKQKTSNTVDNSDKLVNAIKGKEDK